MCMKIKLKRFFKYRQHEQQYYNWKVFSHSMTALAKIDGPQPDWFIIELQGLLEPKINKDEFIDKHGHVKVGRLSKNDEVCFFLNIISSGLLFAYWYWCF